MIISIYKYINKLFIGLLLFMPLSHAMAAGNIDIESIKLSNAGDYQYMVDGSLSFQLSEPLQKALLHGVRLRADIDFTLGKHRIWWWNSAKHISRISYQLRYHALSKHYILKRLGKEQHWTFATLPAALKQLGTIDNHRLPKLSPVVERGNHYIYVSARITTETMSLPLKIQSYFTNSKYLIESEGVLWALP